MPRLMQDENVEVFKLAGNFTFGGTRVETLGATEYTLVTIAVDETGSVSSFANALSDMLITIIDSCKRSPRSDNLLIRVITFGSQYPQGVNEVHGFKPLADINPADYPPIRPGGSTPLYDVMYSAISAMNAYGKKLMEDDFGVNAISFVVTDGDDNASVTTPRMIKEENDKAISGETLESAISVLIGINAQAYKTRLSTFKKSAGITEYIDAGTATKQTLAKLANFVSQSISSQSQALGTGGASQNIKPVI